MMQVISPAPRDTWRSAVAGDDRATLLHPTLIKRRAHVIDLSGLPDAVRPRMHSVSSGACHTPVSINGFGRLPRRL
jgi:hypothetical protein